jgi:2-keto-4-pentenoate hydratase/2-oxohepta-3-ene-1,7-dioic acid hydratase in catechol pathway
VKLSRILRDGPDGTQARIVAVIPDDEVVLDLRAAERLHLERSGASTDAALRVASALFPESLTAAIAAGEIFIRRAQSALDEQVDEAVVPFSDVRWAPAIDPPVMLDASAFEQHLVNAHARGKRPVPDFFYEVPVYYKMNPVTVLGHEERVPWPGQASFMDYELELAIVIGSTGADLTPEEAATHIFGLTVMNDFRALVVHDREMSYGL